MSVFSLELTQSIIKDFTTTKLCTYQIAQKYRLNQRSIKSVIIKNIGADVFRIKEHLAYDNLISEIRQRLAANDSAGQIALDLGLSRSTCFAIIKKITDASENSALDADLQLIPDDNEVCQKNSDSPQASTEPEKVSPQEQNSSPKIIQIENKDSPRAAPLPAPYYHRNYPYYRRRPYRNFSGDADNSRRMISVNINGFFIRFDSSQKGANELLNKIIAVITEQ